MVECSVCGEEFDSLEDYDVHGTVCKPLDDAGVVRHARRVQQQRGGQVAETTAAPERETR